MFVTRRALALRHIHVSAASHRQTMASSGQGAGHRAAGRMNARTMATNTRKARKRVVSGVFPGDKWWNTTFVGAAAQNRIQIAVGGQTPP